MAKVAIDETLQYMEDALREKGYDVVILENGMSPEDCDCCVISGMDENFMGIQTTVTQAPVLDARGMSIDEICEHLNRHI